MTFAYLDTADEALVNSTMAPLLAELGTPYHIFMQSQNWIDSVLYLAGVDSVSDLNTTLAPDTHDDFYATSTFVSLTEMLGTPSSDALMNYFYDNGTNTEVEWFIIL